MLILLFCLKALSKESMYINWVVKEMMEKSNGACPAENPMSWNDLNTEPTQNTWLVILHKFGIFATTKNTYLYNLNAVLSPKKTAYNSLFHVIFLADWALLIELMHTRQFLFVCFQFRGNSGNGTVVWIGWLGRLLKPRKTVLCLPSVYSRKVTFNNGLTWCNFPSSIVQTTCRAEK